MLLRLLLISAVTIGAAQTQDFEVVSVRPALPTNDPGSDGGPGSHDPEHYTYRQAGLPILIMIAYELKNFQLTSRIPLDKDQFDLVAKIPPAATKAEFRVMLQHLLRDRFHLQAHIETKEFAAYELVVAK